LDARGLPMVSPPDPEALAAERAWLVELESGPRPKRYFAFLRRGGPGYLQSALTLGGGSASASLFAGAAFGYQLLWVAPVAMLIGMIMMMAIAHQTLSTGRRPFEAMRTHAGPYFAYGWAIGAILASVIWHFSQYALASGVVAELGRLAEWDMGRGLAGGLILIWAVFSAQLFASGSKGMAWFDRVLKLLVWTIVACFGYTVFKTGVDWSALASGLVPFRVPEDFEGTGGRVSGLQTVMAGLGAAVVINMVFLYPYTLLARGWGREHRRLARFDLFAGMFVPYTLATGLMIIATANTIHASGAFTGQNLKPIEAARILSSTLGEGFGTTIFLLGLLGMLLTTITMHMVSAAFAISEMLGLKFGSWGYRLALLVPTPGFLGAFYWSDIVVWVAVPTSIATAVLLPIAYVAFIKMQSSKAYLGADMPRGGRGRAVLGAMIFGTAVVVVFLVWTLITKLF
jgi:manganese transport protein